MNITLAILLLIAVLSIIYYTNVKPNEQNNESDTFELTSEQIFNADGTEIKEPFTNADFVKGISYLDNQNRKHHDEKMLILSKIKFWLTIIGLYVLIKMIIVIVIIFAEGTLIFSILNEIQKLFKYTI